MRKPRFNKWFWIMIFAFIVFIILVWAIPAAY